MKTIDNHRENSGELSRKKRLNKIRKDIKQALTEVALMENGIIRKLSIDDFLKQL